MAEHKNHRFEAEAMAYFLIRVAVNTLAAASVMNVVPGLRLAPFLGEPFATALSLSTLWQSSHRQTDM